MKKRLAILALMSLSAISCLKGGGYESSYQASITFEQFSPAWDNSSYEGEFYGDDKVNYQNSVVVTDLGFNCIYDEDKDDYTGFALSMATAEDTGYEGRYSANADGGSSGDVFLLFHNDPEIRPEESQVDPVPHVVFYGAYSGTCTPVSCMVNNTKMVADRIAEYNAAHEKGIEIKLKATGYASGTETGSAEVVLASPGAAKEGKDSIMSKWSLMDLKKLGNVEYIHFSLSFSDTEQTEIPEYFCLDDFRADIHISIGAE